MANDIFKSPIRNVPSSSSGSSSSRMKLPPVSPFVDYTPRRTKVRELSRNDDLESTPNGITYARERRSQYYHQLAVDSNDAFPEGHYMDSPSVRRHFGFSEYLTSPPISFNDRMQQAIDLETLSRKTEWTKADFNVGEHLGTGKFGVVFKAVEIRTNQTVALKVMKKKELQEAGIVSFLKREVEIQAHLCHPNIVRLYGYFHDEDEICLVLEYAGENDLHSILCYHQTFTEEETAHYILEIAEALKYMHGLGVFHRDIKLENIMVHQDGTLKIADFGWAVYDPRPRRGTFCGTLDYLPPEMIQYQPHNQSVDVWAVGILCYELLTGRPPFENAENPKDVDAAYQRILNAEVVYPEHISHGARSFIGKLLCKDPSQRIPIHEIDKDPWIQSFNIM